MSLDQVNAQLQAFDRAVSAELAAKAKETDLIPTGYYQFQLHSWTVDAERSEKEFFDAAETKPNALYKHPVANLRLDLLARADKANGEYQSFSKPRPYFLRVTPDLVTWIGQEDLLPESKLFGDLQNAAKASSNGTVLSSSKDVIEHFLEHRGVIHIAMYEGGVSKKTGKPYDAGNKVYSIKAVRAVA